MLSAQEAEREVPDVKQRQVDLIATTMMEAIEKYAVRAIIKGSWTVGFSDEIKRRLQEYDIAHEVQSTAIQIASDFDWNVTFDNLQDCFTFSPRKASCG